MPGAARMLPVIGSGVGPLGGYFEIMPSACPSGFRLISGYLDRPAQEALAAAVAAVLERAPLYTPRMPRSG